MGKIILLAIPDHADPPDLTEEEQRQAEACGRRLQPRHAEDIQLAIFGNVLAERAEHCFRRGHHSSFHESHCNAPAESQAKLARAISGDLPNDPPRDLLGIALQANFRCLNRDPLYIILVLGPPTYLQPILDQLGRLYPEPCPMTSLPLWHAIIAHYQDGKVPKLELLPPE